MIRSRTIDEPALDPHVVAELEALDAALRGDTIDDDQLVALVRDVRAQAAEMPSDLRKRLRHEVNDGFPRTRRGVAGRRGAGRRTRARRTMFAGSGVVVAGIAAVAVVVGLGLDHSGGVEDSATSSAARPGIVNQDQLMNTFDDKTRQGLDRLQGSTSSRNRAPGSAASTSADHSTEQGNAYLRGSVVPQSASAAKPTDSELAQTLGKKPEALNSSSGSASATSSTFSRTQATPVQKLKPAVANLSSSSSAGAAKTRQVEHAVDMSVRVKSGKLDEAVGKVGQIARASGGYVSESQSSLRTRGAGNATFTLRVASAQLDAAVAQLSALGTVTHQDQSSIDITSSFDSVQSRLSDATKVRAALLRALGKAATAGEIASLKTRIADNRTLRASLDTQLNALKRRADLTTISLTLSAPTSGAAAAVADDGRWSLSDALSDTGRILGTVTGGLLVAAGAALPFAILALIAWPIYRLQRRRKREAALGI